MRMYLCITALAIAFAGCQKSTPVPAQAEPAPVQAEAAAPKAAEADEVAVERAKLSPEDLAAVNAQEWCAISNDERLGAMGAPLKIEIDGKPVFLCCKGCKKKAEANPEKTLAKVEELKAKALAQKKDSGN